MFTNRIIGLYVSFFILFFFGVSVAQDKVVVVPLGGAKGDAEASDVLYGKTFSNSTSKGISGKRPPAPVEVSGATRTDYVGDDASNAAQYGESSSARFSIFYDITGAGRYDGLTGLYWELTPPDELDTWTGAIDRCEAKTTGSFFFGTRYDDWRLPNIKELLSLVDRGQYNPALPNDSGINLPSNGWFWTSTPYAAGSPSLIAWKVLMSNGEVTYDTKTLSFYSICVRGQSKAP